MVRPCRLPDYLRLEIFHPLSEVETSPPEQTLLEIPVMQAVNSPDQNFTGIVVDKLKKP
jgi:hypothetical protein